MTEGSERRLVSADEAGRRLEQAVANWCAAIGRREAVRLIAEGKVTVNGRRARKGHRLAEGDEVEFEAPGSPGPLPEGDAALDVRFENEAVLVVAKPPGQPSVAVRPGEAGTLAGALLGHYPELAQVGDDPREAGLVHRLDTPTSGLLVAARHQDAWDTLRQAVSGGRLAKRYFAMVPGASLPESDRIDRALSPKPGNRRRVRVHEAGSSGPDSAYVAVTDYQVVRRVAAWALLEVSAARAYRHQIRAHLAAIGHPIVGDTLYGGATDTELGERLALHANHVAWRGDDACPTFSVDDALPDDIARLLV